MLPPGAGKTTYISQLFSAWYLASWPGARVMVVSHRDELVRDWGRVVRNLILEHGKSLGITLDTSSMAEADWSLLSGGRWFGASVDANISGYRADLAIVDDAYGTLANAWSETIRARRWRWYTTDLSTRLVLGAKRLLTGYRWHEDDLLGRVIAQIESGAIRGEVIRLPAIAEANDPIGRTPGQWLWDDDGYGYPQYLAARRAEMPAYEWSATCQLQPIPDQGEFFKADWFPQVDRLPDRSVLKIYAASDFATKEAEGDYTIHSLPGSIPRAGFTFSTCTVSRRPTSGSSACAI
jgi:hypothetical protein